MLTELFQWLETKYAFPGVGVFRFISFRSALAVMFALMISLVIGKTIIQYLQKLQIGEIVRNLGLEGQMKKEGTPTMGGLIILSSIIIPILLVGKLDNVYVQLLLASTIWMATIGFVDDYIKVFKKNKAGLRSRSKLIGQVGLGLLVGCVLYFNSEVVVREFPDGETIMNPSINLTDPPQTNGVDEHSTKTTIPFFKHNELDYGKILFWLTPEQQQKWAWIIYIPMVIFVVTAVSNGANLTDGLDGLTTGVSAIVGSALLVLAYVSGNILIANYLDIMYLPNVGEVVVFAAAFVGACIGFLWYNSYPAQVFMGDTGSLALGGIIATLALVIRKELLLPILCGVFFIENLSVILQVGYFKYTKKKYGEGRRIFKMSPLHHHYQMLDYHESKIVTRFWIVSLLLAVVAIITLKLR